MNIFNKISEKLKKREIRLQNERVQEEFQVSELDGELWLTFSRCPILPFSMLKDEPITALLKIRELQINCKD
jgi:hypothetical protein